MRYPKDRMGGYFDAESMYGFEINGVSKCCMFWHQGSLCEIGQWICDYVRNTDKAELKRIAEQTKVFDPDELIDQEHADELRAHNFERYKCRDFETVEWYTIFRENGYLLGTIDLGYPFVSEYEKFIMASDWTYIIKIDDIPCDKQSDDSNAQNDISVRFVVYRKLDFYCTLRAPGPDDCRTETLYEDIPAHMLPPIYVPPQEESRRYPNHVLLASFDYESLPTCLSTAMCSRRHYEKDAIAINAKMGRT